MSNLFIFLFCMSLIMLIIGLIKPSLVIRGEVEEKKNRKNVLKYCGLSLLIFFILVIITMPTDTGQNTTKQASDTQIKETIEQEKNEIIEIEQEDEEKINESEKDNQSTESTNETMSQQQAIKKAKDYLSLMAFSKNGLVEQLEFEGFSEEDAIYAVNNIIVDWKEQAVKKAKDYLNLSAFSRNSLIEQLEFEGFTNEEAIHAVNKISL